ncbi:hypothetical protein [Roseovarius pacificus]|uniref:hypothetical protein n=1 Tax=Roseovarius pacificus TaxID=337701 RepID=UPI002A18766D|nr:hypothetical protein [Roseovarius pacificus]
MHTDVLLLLAIGGDGNDERLLRLGATLVDFTESQPGCLIEPLINAEAAALTDKTPGALSAARSRGLAPPGYLQIGKVGRYYQSRHMILSWLAGEMRRDSKAWRSYRSENLRALVAAYPFAQETQDQMVARLAKQAPRYFDEPLSATAAAKVFSKNPDALGSALWRDNGLKALRGTGEKWPNRRTILDWIAGYYQTEQKEAA